MRRFWVLVLMAVLGAGSCGGDESNEEDAPSEVIIQAEMDGARCTIRQSEPSFAPSGDPRFDVLAAVSPGTMTVLYANTSGERYDSFVRRVDAADMTAEEIADFWEGRDGTLFPRPWWLHNATPDTARTDLREAGQTQGDFLLEPGFFLISVYDAADRVWSCRTSDAAVSSLVEVTNG